MTQVQPLPQSSDPDTPHEPFLQKDRVQARRTIYGLDQSTVGRFVEETEFISLGNHCVTSYGLQALDLKRRSYPFDWLRSPLSGVIHLLENEFEDFFTYTTKRVSPASPQEELFATARWGGSFWHHDVEDPKTAEAFRRRIARLLGRSDEVPVTRRRVFVRAVNCTRELDQVQALHAALQRKLPRCQVLLLVLVDFQETEELLRAQTSGDGILVQRIDGAIFAEDCRSWSMELCVENYASGISRAIRHWAGQEATAPRTLPFLLDVGAACEQFDAGDTATETFWPRRFQGQRIVLNGRKPRLPRLLRSDIPPQPSKEVLVADWVVPADVSVGDVVQLAAFGQRLQLTVPSGASPGSRLRLQQAHGAVTAALLLSATATATATAASTVAASTATAAVAAAAATTPTPNGGFMRAPLRAPPRRMPLGAA